LTINLRSALLLAYGLLNAILYASLLPLWEGFDEEFHYGYVQYLGVHHRFPVLEHTGLSQEINWSISLLPMSHVMIDNLHLQGVWTFDEYFARESVIRHRLYGMAWRIPPGLGAQESIMYGKNYEVHHAPLAYLAMAIPDGMMHGTPLPVRVLCLRLIAALAAAFLMFFGVRELARGAGLNETLGDVLIFLVFSCQMFWAAVAHVANDWLAVPLAVWVVVETLRYDRERSLRVAVRLSVVLALGLLSKAYFLVFVPLYLVAAIVWRRQGALANRAALALVAMPALLAGPWYLRNLLLYGNLSGRLEESSGVTTTGALRSLVSIPWIKSVPFMARGAIWMGNSSFTDFSVRTMNAALLLIGIGAVLYFWPALRRRPFPAPRVAAIVWLPVLFFCAAMVYVTGSTYTYSKGLAKAASPWYLQAVMPMVLCGMLLGCQRSLRIGRWVAVCATVLWGYVLAATYLAKLFPLYGGFSRGRTTLSEVLAWYASSWHATCDILDTTALAPAAVLAILLVCVLATLAILLPVMVRRIFRSSIATFGESAKACPTNATRFRAPD
jgi:hypothetical protein